MGKCSYVIDKPSITVVFCGRCVYSRAADGKTRRGHHLVWTNDNNNNHNDDDDDFVSETNHVTDHAPAVAAVT